MEVNEQGIFLSDTKQIKAKEHYFYCRLCFIDTEGSTTRTQLIP